MKTVPANRYAIFFSILIVGCAVDLLTKEWMFDWLGMPSGQVHWLVDGVVGAETSLNEGALFGMGQGKVALFAFFSIAASIGMMVWLFLFRAAEDLYLTVVLGMINAGVFGNLYDRLGMHGLVWEYANPWHAVGEPVYAVRDWILVMIGSYHWPNFNIADSLLVCGACLLALHAVLIEWRQRKTPPTPE